MTYEEWLTDKVQVPSYRPTNKELYQWCLHYYNKGALDALNQLKLEVEDD